MHLFGVLCLVATTIALPLELPPAPQAVITIPETKLRTNLPLIAKAENELKEELKDLELKQNILQEELKDIKTEEAKIQEEREVDEKRVVLQSALPVAPQLPPMHESVREYLYGENKELSIVRSRIPNISYPSTRNVIVTVTNL